MGLDTRIRHDLFDVISTLREQTGVTIIMTTHYLDEAERLCDRLAIIDWGTIIACDTPDRTSFPLDRGLEVLEVRVGRSRDRAADVLRRAGGSPHEDVVVIGQTVTASLAGHERRPKRLHLLEEKRHPRPVGHHRPHHPGRRLPPPDRRPVSARRTTERRLP